MEEINVESMTQKSVMSPQNLTGDEDSADFMSQATSYTMYKVGK